jgi:uncharacterized membrane protein YhaH (DUF805 family)
MWRKRKERKLIEQRNDGMTDAEDVPDKPSRKFSNDISFHQSYLGMFKKYRDFNGKTSVGEFWRALLVDGVIWAILLGGLHKACSMIQRYNECEKWRLAENAKSLKYGHFYPPLTISNGKTRFAIFLILIAIYFIATFVPRLSLVKRFTKRNGNGVDTIE